MPPKPGAKQIRKPAPRRRKPNTINLQLAVGQSMDYTATAVNPGATSAMPPPFLAPVVPGSALARVSEAPMAQEYVDPYTRLPPSSSHSTSSVLPSPSLTDEASPASAHAPAEPYEQPTAASTGTAMALPSIHESINYQTTSSQDGAVQRPAQELNQPAKEPVPLHTTLMWAISVVRLRVQDIKDGKFPGNDAEQNRCGMLLSACHDLDPVFLIVHQQCSCWKLDRKAAYATLFPIPPELIDVAFSELCTVFIDDRQITDPHWQWFSNFPGFRNVVGLDRVNIQAKDFIATFAMNWPILKRCLLSQLMPPMAHQIREELRCVSNSIASALFKRIRRAIGVPDGPFSAKINHLFTMDNRQELVFEEQSVPQEEVDIIRSTMLATYRGIVQEALDQDHPPVVILLRGLLTNEPSILKTLSPQRLSKTSLSFPNFDLNFQLNLSPNFQLDLSLSLSLSIRFHLDLNFHLGISISIKLKLKLSFRLNLKISINLNFNLEFNHIGLDFHLHLHLNININLNLNLHLKLKLNIQFSLSINFHPSLNLNFNLNISNSLGSSPSLSPSPSPSSPVCDIQVV
ncbi:uncharacterized protein Triagg1_8592 [Trichoderma aggressivum f. europaeum]|uniref:Uncharacterized protein n=1 Tax=Trichoderma aggressivum f. europaeum TaxID=173218 RepID=A0AAE1I7Q0_9HYPO|nr:hypothetical protein Triagg1_8592 [Trichoderma aggressivum f. europaeum]